MNENSDGASKPPDNREELQSKVSKRILEMSQEDTNKKKQRKRVSYVNFPAWGDDSNHTSGKYIKISTIDSTKSLIQYDAVYLGAWIDKYIPGSTNQKQTRDGSIMLRTKDEKQFHSVQKITEIHTPTIVIKIKIEPLTSMNQVQGIIYAEELMGTDLSRIPLMYKDIVEIKRLTRFKDGIQSESKNHLITFAKNVLPSEVKIGWTSFQVKPYYPRPRTCRKCYSYSHTIKFCKAEHFKCKKCGKNLEILEEEQTVQNGVQKTKTTFKQHDCNGIHCLNCPDSDNNHLTDSQDCPLYHIEKAITTIKIDKNLPYGTARREFIEINKKATQDVSYAHLLHESTNERSTVQSQIEQVNKQLDELRREKAILTKLREQLIAEQATNESLRKEIEELKNRNKGPTSQRRGPKALESKAEWVSHLKPILSMTLCHEPCSSSYTVVPPHALQQIMNKMNSKDQSRVLKIQETNASSVKWMINGTTLCYALLDQNNQ